MPEGVPVEESEPTGESTSRGVVFVNTRERVPKDFFIQEKDLRNHGFTRGCPGCGSIQRGRTRQPHNQACRNRFAEILKGTAKVVNAEKRKSEFEERELK